MSGQATTPHQRVQAECDEMKDRIEKLQAFLLSDRTHVIDQKQVRLMTGQLSAMLSYHWFLTARLDLFEGGEVPF
jgi:hypothetical protein